MKGLDRRVSIAPMMARLACDASMGMDFFGDKRCWLGPGLFHQRTLESLVMKVCVFSHDDLESAARSRAAAMRAQCAAHFPMEVSTSSASAARSAISCLYSAHRRRWLSRVFMQTRDWGEPLRSVTCLMSSLCLSICRCRCWRRSLRTRNRCVCCTGSQAKALSSRQSAQLHDSSTSCRQSSGGAGGYSLLASRTSAT